MEKRGISNHAKDLFAGLAAFFKGFRHAHGNGEPAAHADDRIHCRKGSCTAERVATDIARDDGVLALAEHIEETSVRTARAERRGTRYGAAANADNARLFAEHRFADNFRVEFVHIRNQCLADAEDARGLDLILQERVELLDDIQRFHLLGKRADETDGKRPGKAEFEERRIFREGFLCVLVGNGRRDHADLVALEFHPVERAGLGVFREMLKLRFQHRAVALGVGGRAYKFRNVARIRGNGAFLSFAKFDQALAVANARSHAKQHGQVEALRNFVGFLHEILAFLRVAWFHKRNLGKGRVAAVILLVLGRMHIRVVRADNHKPRANAVISGGKDRVGGNVDAHMLHG
ncbi:hypothetical protein SDC9_113054 [bioreactor metagenome]|uniref:Uncharacterized protein n=1 Tax=bioreactor metagenome TaxID=1076179 RepID=A0A645BLN6_9ZZZZ